MSNVLTTNPIVYDTVGATSAITVALKINAIVWAGGDTAGDVCQIQTKSGGNIVFAASIGTVGDTVVFCPTKPIEVPGLYLATMGGGTAYIYI